MEREGKAAGGRVVAAHLVCLCCGGGWRKPIGLWRIFLGRILGRNSVHTDDTDTDTDRQQFNLSYECHFLLASDNKSGRYYCTLLVVSGMVQVWCTRYR
jgi:hypothetical protein